MPKHSSTLQRPFSLSRRTFIFLSGSAAAAAALSGCATARPRVKSANEKLKIGVVGAGGKGSSDTAGVASENIVALCDVDQNRLLEAARKYPGARLYQDYRVMLEQQREIDAIVVS